MGEFIAFKALPRLKITQEYDKSEARLLLHLKLEGGAIYICHSLQTTGINIPVHLHDLLLEDQTLGDVKKSTDCLASHIQKL